MLLLGKDMGVILFLEKEQERRFESKVKSGQINYSTFNTKKAVNVHVNMGPGLNTQGNEVRNSVLNMTTFKYVAYI